ncbi:predicted protein [Naegleria gruberi]|uniref:Predicted protein n=1 Tax=Naegleria gruberi TaxID=5762 RepID=D2VVJ0_NAEGR|nr:uncharacterized protein NAEGRDRAFT_73036 [Naegleria gruberi]EFC39042.1 predicted protein [Naegleria gruberi]|eukprot:XP_002671786.1 predicted protein [Naegleria gruberi strain NEG-M]
MSVIENINKAFQLAFKISPKVGKFPYLAETLRRAGIERNRWFLPGCTSIYYTSSGEKVVNQMESLLPYGMHEIKPFNRNLVVDAIRKDQAGETEFPQFLKCIWEGGVVSYEVDFVNRVCTYYGADEKEFYEEYYSHVDINTTQNE